MANYCELCAKQTMAGRHIRHAHSVGWLYRAPKKPRTFKANLRKVQLYNEDGTKSFKVTSCMKCYKKLRNEAEAEMQAMEAQAKPTTAKKASK